MHVLPKLSEKELRQEWGTPQWLFNILHEALAEAIGEGWIEPLIANSADGEMVFEWWGRGQKKLTLYLTEESIDYIRVWGTDIHEEMDDGQIDNPEALIPIWQWLHKCDGKN